MREIETASSFHQNSCIQFVKREGQYGSELDFVYIKTGDTLVISISIIILLKFMSCLDSTTYIACQILRSMVLSAKIQLKLFFFLHQIISSSKSQSQRFYNHRFKQMFFFVFPVGLFIANYTSMFFNILYSIVVYPQTCIFLFFVIISHHSSGGYILIRHRTIFSLHWHSKNFVTTTYNALIQVFYKSLDILIFEYQYMCIRFCSLVLMPLVLVFGFQM